MRSKILTGAAAVALTATAGLATTVPASAHYARWSTGNAVTDIAADVVGGAFAAATLPFWATDSGYYGGGYYGGYSPGYAYEPSYVYEPGYAYVPGYSYAYMPGHRYAPGYSYAYVPRRSYAYVPGYSYRHYGPYGSHHGYYRLGPHPR